MTRFGYVMAAYFASAGTLVMAFVTPEPRLIWNASASVPEGLYAIGTSSALRRGDLVALRPSRLLSVFMARRHYLPLGVPLLKHVVGIPGDRICRVDQHLIVNGTAAGEALTHDRRGRALPRWQGCQALSAGQLFVMNSDVRDSFDGRYIGPIDRTRVIGRATPLWLAGAPQPPGRRVHRDAKSKRPGIGS